MGVLLDEAICMQKQGHDIYFVHCNNTINTCFSNPKEKKKYVFHVSHVQDMP